MLNQSQGSSSLIIVQEQHIIEINSSAQKSKREEQLFQLSRDDPTISFLMEQSMNQIEHIIIREEKKAYVQTSVMASPVIVEQKKKRKDIFNRFKKPELIVRQPKAQDNLLNIFDSIFKCKNQQNSIGSQNTIRQSKLQANNFLNIAPIQRNKTPSHQKRQRQKIFAKKQYAGHYSSILPSDINQDQIQQKKPQPKLRQSSSLKKIGNEILNFSSIENRYSAILTQDIDVDTSREQLQFKRILQEQIFNEQQKIVSPLQIKEQNMANKQVKIQSPQSPNDKILMKQVPNAMKSPLDLLQTKQSILKHVNYNGQKEIVYNVGPQAVEESRYVTNNIYTNIPLTHIEQSHVRNDTSILSMASIKVDQYRTASNGSIGGHSMVNGSTVMIDYMVRQASQSNIQFSSRMYESQIVDMTTIVKMNIFQEQERMPIFLRKIRKILSVYPNLYIANNNPNTFERIKQEFNNLFDLFKEAIDVLNVLCQKILDIKAQKHIYMTQMLNGFNLEFFLTSGWENIVKKEDFQVIKPRENFNSRVWSFQKAKVALTNYNNIVQYYQNKGIKVDLSTSEGKSKYFQIRQKFLDISGNMRLISQDVYCEYINLNFPPYYTQFLSFLKEKPKLTLTSQRQSLLRQYLNLYKTLKYKKEMLIVSEIGTKIKQKIDFQMRYLRAF